MPLKCQQLYLEEIFRGKDTGKRNYLAVQWLGLHAFTAMGPGSILGGKTKIPQGLQHRPTRRHPHPPQKKKIQVENLGSNPHFARWLCNFGFRLLPSLCFSSQRHLKKKGEMLIFS